MKKKPASSRTALVTGGSGGIGRAIAAELEKQGVNVVIADISVPQNRTNTIFRKCDVTRPDEVDSLFAFMSEHTGLPDILILNAGKGIHEKLCEGDPEKWHA